MKASENYKLSIPAMRAAALREALAVLGQADEAEDVTQEVLLKLWERRESLETDPKRLAAYAGQTARNKALNLVRDRKRHPIVGLFRRRNDDDEEDDEDRPITALGTSDTPQRHLESKEMQQIYLAALRRLPPTWRRIVMMRNDDDLSFAHIAQITGSTESAVRGTLSKARQRLFQLIKNQLQ